MSSSVSNRSSVSSQESRGSWISTLNSLGKSIPGASTVSSYASSFFLDSKGETVERDLHKIEYKSGLPIVYPVPAATSHEKACAIAEMIWRADYGEPSIYDQILHMQAEMPLMSTRDWLLQAANQLKLSLNEFGVGDVESLQEVMVDPKTSIPRSVVARISNPEEGYYSRYVIIDEVKGSGTIFGRDADYGSVREFSPELFFGKNPQEIRVLQVLPRKPEDIQCWRKELVDSWSASPKNEQELLRQSVNRIISQLKPGDLQAEITQTEALCKDLSLSVQTVTHSEKRELFSLLKQELEAERHRTSTVLLPQEALWVVLNHVTFGFQSVSYEVIPQKSEPDLTTRSLEDSILRKTESGKYLALILSCESF